MSVWVRFKHPLRSGIGLLEGQQISFCSAEEKDLYKGVAASGEKLDANEATLLAPCSPGKMIALWNNYAALADKNKLTHPCTPLYLFKPPNSFAGPDTVIHRPKFYEGDVFYEGELGIVIGKTVCNLQSIAHGNDAIFGYTCVNDVTAFGLLKEYEAFDQWSRSKGFDGFGLFGPVIATGLDWRELEIVTLVNGEEVQHYPAKDMILSPPEIVVELSHNMTLYPGDVVCCGTSIGLGPMPDNCIVEIRIDGIGSLRNSYQS